MKKRTAIKTKMEDVVNYWSIRVGEFGLSIDWREANDHCWRCGCKKNLERCHIIPDALGGKDEPANIVLLCKRCHAEGPNVSDPEIMWDWIRAYGNPLYETFWAIRGMKEYEFIYGHKFDDHLNEIVQQTKLAKNEEEILKMVNEAMKMASERCSIHFSQPYFNIATIAGMYRMMIKDIAKKYDVDVP